MKTTIIQNIRTQTQGMEVQGTGTILEYLAEQGQIYQEGNQDKHNHSELGLGRKQIWADIGYSAKYSGYAAQRNPILLVYTVLYMVGVIRYPVQSYSQY